MSRLLIWTMSIAVVFGTTGCVNQLNDDWLALNKTQCAITDKLLDFETAHMNVMKGLMEKYFTLLEQEITFRESSQFLDPRTVLVDGVERIMVEGPNGQAAAVSRADLEKFIGEAIEARALLAMKKAEWNHVFSEWEKVLADVNASNNLSLQAAKDIYIALESAQRVLDDVTRVVGTLTATTAMYFLAG